MDLLTYSLTQDDDTVGISFYEAETTKIEGYLAWQVIYYLIVERGCLLKNELNSAVAGFTTYG